MNPAENIWQASINILATTCVASTVCLLAALLLGPAARLTSAVRITLFRTSILLASLPLFWFVPAMNSIGDGVPTAGPLADFSQPSAVPSDDDGQREMTAERERSVAASLESSGRAATGSHAGPRPVAVTPGGGREEPAARPHDSRRVEPRTGDRVFADRQLSETPRHLSPRMARTIVLTWMAVAALLLLRQLSGAIFAAVSWQRRLRRSGLSLIPLPQDATTTTMLPGKSRTLPACFSDIPAVPIVVGIVRPVILVPLSWRTSSIRRLSMILQHESHHIRRHDIIWNLLINLLAAVLWFQPLAWILRRQHRLEQEKACDDAVLESGHPPRDYALLLTEIAESARICRRAGQMALSMAGRSRIEDRIHCILDRHRRRDASRRKRFLWSTGYSLSAVCLSLALVARLPQLSADDESVTATANSNRRSTEQLLTVTRPVARPSAPSAADHGANAGLCVLKGRVVDESGSGVQGASVFLEGRHQLVPQAVSDADGWFELQVPRQAELRQQPVILTAEHAASMRLGMIGLRLPDYWDPAFDGTPALPPSIPLQQGRLQSVEVMDAAGEPIAGGFAGVLYGRTVISVARTDRNGLAKLFVLTDVPRPPLQIFALAESHGLEFQDVANDPDTAVRLVLNDSAPLSANFQVPMLRHLSSTGQVVADSAIERQRLEPLVGVSIVPEMLSGDEDRHFACGAFLCSRFSESLCPRTDTSGNLSIPWMPDWAVADVSFCIADEQLWSSRDIRSFSVLLEDPPREVVVDRLVDIGGMVIDADRKPVAGAIVTTAGHSLLRLSHDPFQSVQKTGPSGKFTLRVPTRHRYLIHAELPGKYSSAVEFDILAGTAGDDDILQWARRTELQFSSGNVISGRITSGPAATPLPHRAVQLRRTPGAENHWRFMVPRQYARAELEYMLSISAEVRTDENGSFHVITGDGGWQIQDPFEEPFDRRMPLRFSVAGGLQVQKDFHSDDRTLLRVQTVEKASGQPISARVDIWGNTGNTFSASGVSEHLVPREARAIQAVAEAGDASGFILWDGKSEEITIPLAPTVSLRGRIVDDSGNALPDRTVRYVISPLIPKGSQPPQEPPPVISGSLPSGVDGDFELLNVIQDCRCEVMVTADEDKEWATKQWVIVATVSPDGPAPIDLGPLKALEIR